MKYRVKVEHTFELTEDDMELAQLSYRAYGEPDEKLHDYIKSNLISQGQYWLQSVADEFADEFGA